MPLEISTTPGLRLTDLRKLKLVGEPILTSITGDPWIELERNFC